MENMKNVANISVSQYIEFLNCLHGPSRLRSFEIKEIDGSTPEVHIVRSSIKSENGCNRYCFADNKRNNGYYAVWQDEDGAVKDISKRFNEFVNSIPEKIKIDYEMFDEM